MKPEDSGSDQPQSAPDYSPGPDSSSPPPAQATGVINPSIVAPTAPTANPAVDQTSLETTAPSAPNAADLSELESNLEQEPGEVPVEPPAVTPPGRERFSPFRYNKLAFAITATALLIITLIGGGSLVLLSKHSKAKQTDAQKTANYAVSSLPLGSVKANSQLQLGDVDNLSINGQLQVNSTLVLSPASTPDNPTAGQIYYSKATNEPYYYNGTQFVSLAPQAGVSSLGGSSGSIGLGDSLSVVNNQLAVSSSILQQIVNTGASAPHVSSLQGQTGDVTLGSGPGISINGTTISNSGVLSLAGTANQVNVSAGSGSITLSLPQDIAATSSPVFGGLTVSGAIAANTLQQTASGNNLNISAGNDTISFIAGGRTFIFPTTGPSSQTICTTGISCASGGGQAVLLQPGSAQTDPGSGSSIFINNTAGGNLLELQGSGTDHFVVTNAGNVTASGTIAIQGANALTLGTASTNTGAIVFKGSGGVGTLTLQGPTTPNTGNFTLTIPAITANDTLCVATMANCTAIGAAGGDLTGNYPNPTIAKLQGKTLTVSATPVTGSVLQYNGSAFVDGLVTNANLQAGTFANITGTGALVAGSIASGFGTISTGNNITTTATVQGGIVNATTALQLGGVDINTAGTLTNVAYLNGTGPQTFTGNNKFTGTFLAQNAANSTTAFQIQNAAGTTTLFSADTTNGLVNIGSSTLIVDAVNSKVSIGGVGTAKFNINTSGIGEIINVTGSNDILQLKNNGASVATIGSAGNTLFRNSTDSTTAFQIQNAAGTSNLFSVDTTNTQITVGPAQFGMTNSNVSIGGALLSNVKLSVNTANIGAQITETGTSDILRLRNGTTNVVTVGSTGNTLFQNSTDSTNAFQIQNAAGTSNLLVADTTNTRLAVGQASASYTLDVAGDINSTGIYRIGGVAVLRYNAITSGVFVGNSGNASQTGLNNDALGINALASLTTGAQNLAFGSGALTSDQDGDNNIAVGGNALGSNVSGNQNVAVGRTALFANTGFDNVALGYQAGYTSVSGNANVGGGNNTFIGYQAGPGTATQLNYATALGSNAVVSQSDSVVLGCVSGINGCITNSKVGIDTASPGYTLDVNGNINTNTAYLLNGANINTAGTLTNVAYLNGTGPQTFTGNNAFTGTFLSQSATNSATAFQVQNAAGTDNSDTLLGVSTLYPSTNLAANGSFEQDTNGWAAKGANMAISTVTGVAAPYGSSAMQIANNGTAPPILSGAKYPVALSSNTAYAVSFYAKLSGSSSAFTTLTLGRSDDGITDTACTSSTSGSVTTFTPVTANWTRIACTFTTGTVSGSPYIFIGQNDTTTGRILYVDGVSLVQTAGATYYTEGQLNLNGLALGSTLIQPAASSSTAFVVVAPNGTTDLQVNTLSSTITLGVPTTFNSTATVNATSATALVVRNATTTAPLVLANTTILNIDNNGSFEASTSSATGYASNHAGVTLSVDTTANNAYIGNNTGKLVTTTSAVANSGLKYNMVSVSTGNILLASNTTYTLSFFAKIPSGTFTTLTAGRSDDGTTGSETTCALSSTTAATYWQRYTCSFTTGTTSGTPYFFIGQSDAGVAHTYFLDGIQIESGTAADNYREGKVQLNGDISSPTVFRPQSDSASAFQIQNSSGNTLFNVNSATAQVTISGGTNTYNTANATLYIGSDSGTGRSINASGTVNASGADYAEWIPWSGAKPDTGSIVTYQGSNYVVSSPETAAFVGNDGIDEANAIMVTFAGQVPVKVTGTVASGDILVDNGDGTAKAINPSSASLANYLGKIGIAQEDSTDAGVKLVKAAIGTTGANTAADLQQSSSNFTDLNVSGTATINNLIVTGSATIASLHVTGSARFDGDITVAGHIITAGGQPTSQPEVAAGGSASVSVDGTDTTGTITINTGSDPGAGDLAKILFSKTYGKAPHIVLSPSNDRAAGLRFYKGSTTSNDFMFDALDNPAPNTTYTFDYFIAQ